MGGFGYCFSLALTSFLAKLSETKGEFLANFEESIMFLCVFFFFLEEFVSVLVGTCLL